MRGSALMIALAVACESVLLAPATLAQTAAPAAPAFDATPAPAAPNYARRASWAAFPGRPDASAAIPAGAAPRSGMRDVDVFYIHPTTYRSMQSWNQDVADKATNDWTDGSVIARQASVFNACCRVFAPRYRQASMLAVRDRLLEADGGKAYALAYSDIERAFESYLRRQNRGRPFIIAGHSQGALMAYWLLRDHVDSRPLQDRMVAAYLVGVDLVEGDFGRTFRSLRPCEASTATGCVIAWNAVNTAMDIRAMKGVAGGRFARTHGVREGLDLVCINPLTFDMARPEADRGAAQGAVVGVPDASPIGPLQRGAVSAACRDGWLVVDVDPALGLTPLPGGSMHYHDYGLFYQDIRTNVRDRIAAFKRR